MKKWIILWSLALWMAPVWANKIAVLDQNAALFTSKVAQAENARMQQELAEPGQQRQQLADQIKGMVEQYQKDEAIMSASEVTEMENRIARAQQQYSQLNAQLNQAQQQREQAFVAKYREQMIEAIQQVLAKGEYDLVLDAEAVIYVKDSQNITQAVLDAFNERTAN